MAHQTVVLDDREYTVDYSIWAGSPDESANEYIEINAVYCGDQQVVLDADQIESIEEYLWEGLR